MLASIILRERGDKGSDKSGGQKSQILIFRVFLESRSPARNRSSSPARLYPERGMVETAQRFHHGGEATERAAQTHWKANLFIVVILYTRLKEDTQRKSGLHRDLTA